MTEHAPAVALLFDDTELGAHLREALSERGARIVHEGGVSTLSHELLQRVAADVIVVNLDDSADDALDRLYELVDGDRPRLVFNDAQASRSLSGWDRARWARHLAVKVLAAGDIDPPRPHESNAVEVPPGTVSAKPVADDLDAVLVVPVDDAVEEPVEAVQFKAEPNSEESGFVAYDQAGLSAGQDAVAESESLASELEALLASGELPEEAELAGPGMRYLDNDALHDGNFGEQTPPFEADAGVDVDEGVGAGPGQPQVPSVAPMPPELKFDHLELAALTEPPLGTTPASVADEPGSVVSPPAVQAPDAWALLDDETPPAESAPEGKPDAAAFGIQKMSAADFLAPESESIAPDFEPTMSLELVSMAEAIAPQAYAHDREHEMVLDEPGSALSRVVLLGAAVDGVESVCAFLAALPASTRLTFLHTQHLGEHSDIALAEKLGEHCALPVRLASPGRRASAGEVLMVPAGQQVRLRRDGSVELQSLGSETELDPSIDSSFTMAANAFGRDAVAIIFAGRGNDAVAGAQAIHDRGGEVWVESSSGEHFADMVSGIFAERLVRFSGTSSELAAHLLEVCS